MKLGKIIPGFFLIFAGAGLILSLFLNNNSSDFPLLLLGLFAMGIGIFILLNKEDEIEKIKTIQSVKRK